MREDSHRLNDNVNDDDNPKQFISHRFHRFHRLLCMLSSHELSCGFHRTHIAIARARRQSRVYSFIARRKLRIRREYLLTLILASEMFPNQQLAVLTKKYWSLELSKLDYRRIVNCQLFLHRARAKIKLCFSPVGF